MSTASLRRLDCIKSCGLNRSSQRRVAQTRRGPGMPAVPAVGELLFDHLATLRALPFRAAFASDFRRPNPRDRIGLIASAIFFDDRPRASHVDIVDNPNARQRLIAQWKVSPGLLQRLPLHDGLNAVLLK